MNLTEIFKIENNRTDDDLFKIYLFYDKDWWRAYEWSAYLCQHFPNNLQNRDKLKVTHRRKDDAAMVGLKLQSFSKYFPSVDTPNIIDDKIELDVKELMQIDECNIDSYFNILSEWKKTVPFIEDSSKNNATPQKQEQISSFYPSTNVSLTSVMQEILAYPLENKTPIDNTLFIRHLKDNLLKLF